MPIHRLAASQNFHVEWSSGVDSWGVYIFRLQTADAREWFDIDQIRVIPQCFIDRDLIPSLIKKLRSTKKAITLVTRVGDDRLMRRKGYSKAPFVPTFQRKTKKEGGEWGKAYYSPLKVKRSELFELANVLEDACSYTVVKHLEETESSEYYSILDGYYLKGGKWKSLIYSVITDNSVPRAIQILPTS